MNIHNVHAYQMSEQTNLIWKVFAPNTDFAPNTAILKKRLTASYG